MFLNNLFKNKNIFQNLKTVKLLYLKNLPFWSTHSDSSFITEPFYDPNKACRVYKGYTLTCCKCHHPIANHVCGSLVTLRLPTGSLFISMRRYSVCVSVWVWVYVRLCASFNRFFYFFFFKHNLYVGCSMLIVKSSLEKDIFGKKNPSHPGIRTSFQNLSLIMKVRWIYNEHATWKIGLHINQQNSKPVISKHFAKRERFVVKMHEGQPTPCILITLKTNYFVIIIAVVVNIICNGILFINTFLIKLLEISYSEYQKETRNKIKKKSIQKKKKPFVNIHMTYDIVFTI